MNQIFRILVSLALVLMLGFQTVDACSFTPTPLRKLFRKADSVFVGTVLSLKKYEPSQKEKSAIPKSWRDWKILSKIKFKVTDKLKGNLQNEQEFIAVPAFPCGCPDDFSLFEENKEYLVFASEKTFISVCLSYKTENDNAKNKIKRLDSFWFRTWARIYPF